MKKQEPVIPRPGYPRPQMVRDNWLNLNGLWEFQADPGLSGINQKDFLSCVWYRREFHLPEDWKDKRVFLQFGAVDYETTVWINGEKMEIHQGGYTPFSLEITFLLRREKNVLVVRAFDDVRSDLQPSGKEVGERKVSARRTMFFTVELSEIYPWQPGRPFLYDLEFSLKEEGDYRDRVAGYFGLRKIEIQGNIGSYQ